MGIGGEGQRAGAGAAPAGADRCGREGRRGRAIVRDFRGEAGATGRGAGHAGCPRRHASKHQLPGHGRQPARAPGPPGRGGLPVPAASEWGRLRLLSQERSGKGARDALEKAAGTTADGSSGAPRPPAAPSSADGRRGRPPWDPPSEPRQTQTEGPGTQHLPGTLQMCRLGGGRRDGGAGSGHGAQGRGLGRTARGGPGLVLALSTSREPVAKPGRRARRGMERRAQCLCSLHAPQSFIFRNSNDRLLTECLLCAGPSLEAVARSTQEHPEAPGAEALAGGQPPVRSALSPPGPAPSADSGEDPQVRGPACPLGGPCSRLWGGPAAATPRPEGTDVCSHCRMPGERPSVRGFGGRPRLETTRTLPSAALASGCQAAVQVMSTGHPSPVGAGDLMTAVVS